ncbi:Ger(x)C family spore germination protein [Pelosinus fermentans]|uniref:Germination protein, Ger(X)C family n=1 Tax=Pelosinus fermentans JBW45 TaxID=1192197 RepID=I9NSK0_9FIRM|nr:Ger(x)C family spore germination protein [Pelosinus fermentans]AJQ29295.1 germination protein, Ger(x)C family [Pelosinus fermentans JBW45]
MLFLRNFGVGKWSKICLGSILFITISLLIGGCWDQRELQERLFVLAVAIDKADEGGDTKEEKEKKSIENFVQPHGNKLYRLSYQILQLTPASGSGEGARKASISTYVISSTGESMFEMLRDMLGQVSKGFWFEHLQAIVISEAAARQGGLQPLIDLFRRDTEMRWLIKLLITSGEAKKLLEYKPPDGEPGGIFLSDSLHLYKKNPHVPGWIPGLGETSQAIDNKKTVQISRVELVEDIVKIGGTALFKEGKFVGYIDEYATKGTAFFSAAEKSAIITIECPDHPGKILAFELFRHETKLTVHVNGEDIYYTLDIGMKGNLGESQCGNQYDTMDEEAIHKVELLVAEEVKHNILYAFHMYQELQVDPGDFGTKLRAYQPLAWERVKEHWDEAAFPNVSLFPSVNVTIENIGSHK